MVAKAEVGKRPIRSVRSACAVSVSLKDANKSCAARPFPHAPCTGGSFPWGTETADHQVRGGVQQGARIPPPVSAQDLPKPDKP